MNWRDRVKELRRVPANTLIPHAENWRKHPAKQRRAWESVLGEIGFAGAILARENERGELEILDGHLRAAALGSDLVPVLVLDLTTQEARKLLAVFDTLSNSAEIDDIALRTLSANCDFADPAIRELFIALEAKPPRKRSKKLDDSRSFESYQLVVTCHGEDDQRLLFERLTTQGYACRIVNLG